MIKYVSTQKVTSHNPALTKVHICLKLKNKNKTEYLIYEISGLVIPLVDPPHPLTPDRSKDKFFLEESTLKSGLKTFPQIR